MAPDILALRGRRDYSRAEADYIGVTQYQVQSRPLMRVGHNTKLLSKRGFDVIETSILAAFARVLPFTNDS